MRSTRALRLLIVLTALSVPSGAVSAQRYWHDDQGRDAFHLDVWLPFLKDTMAFKGHKFFTGAIVPSVSIRAGEGIRVEADFPVMRAGYQPGTGSKLQSFRLGNPYLGIRIGDDEKLVTGVLGARIPAGKKPTSVVSQMAVSAGAVSNYDEFEAFNPNLLTFRGALELHKVRPSGFLVGLRGGPSLQMNTTGDPTGDTEIYFDYGARLGYQGSRALATAALTGRYLITAPAFDFVCLPAFPAGCDPKSFAARTHHAVSGVFEFRPGRVRPRATLRFPLDKDLRTQAGAVLGLGLSIAH
jgi:hypothetical protein